MYIAKKPCHFQGRIFRIGESVPEEVIDMKRVPALVKWGMIAEVDGKAPETEEKASEAVKAKVPDAAQTAQDAPESTGNAGVDKEPAEEVKAVKTAKRGGRKKAGA